MLNRSHINTLMQFIFFAISAGFLYFSIQANTDLTAGRFALFMDEQITFDGVKAILHSENIKDFFYMVLHGDDSRYGRSLWNSIAIFSFLPEIIWNNPAQIIAGRMLQVFLLILSCYVFSFGILTKWNLRIIFSLAFFSLPYASYYATMPKPEPLQILFLSLFCLYYIKNNFAFGVYWIFAGLAFGTKISALPVIFVLFIAAILYNYFTNNKKQIHNVALSLALFLIGASIAAPILIFLSWPFIGFFLLYHFRRHLYPSIKQYILKNLILNLFFLFSFILTLKIRTTRGLILFWLRQTFLGTVHGSDSINVNVFTWIDYFFEKWIISPKAIFLILAVASMIYIIFCFKFNLNKKKEDARLIGAFFIAFSGLVLNFSIFVFSKRLWGMYLFPGSVLTILGLVLIIDSSDKENKIGIINFLKNIILLSLSVISILYWVPKTINEFRILSNRTKTNEYVIENGSYLKVLDFLDYYHSTINRRVKVIMTPSLFIPDSTDKYEIHRFWGPYTNWELSPDVIIFGESNTPRGESVPNTSPSYSAFLIEREGYNKHVVEKGQKCQSTPCFERQQYLPNKAEILVLRPFGSRP